MYAISNELAIQEMEAFFETPFYGPIYYDHLNNGYALPVITNPELPDTDGDGLKDWTVTYNKDNTRVIAPADNNPLKETVPHGIWNKHLEEEESGELIATDYSKNNNGFKLIPYQEIADFLVMVLLNYLYDPIEENQEKIRPILLYIKDLADPHTEIGAYFLNFILDNKKLAYHSQIETWQKTLGYNDFYDLFFGTASYMLHKTLEFSSNNNDYILWLWKGDYWNLQSGAEMGLYVASDKPEISGDSGIPHYEVVDFTLPMTLDLYTFENNSISTILKWHPEIDQWWITGFNHKHTYSNPYAMTMITSVDFSNKYESSTGEYINAEKLYEDLKSTEEKGLINSEGSYDLIFDDNNHTVWIVFYQGVFK